MDLDTYLAWKSRAEALEAAQQNAEQQAEIQAELASLRMQMQRFLAVQAEQSSGPQCPHCGGTLADGFDTCKNCGQTIIWYKNLAGKPGDEELLKRRHLDSVKAEELRLEHEVEMELEAQKKKAEAIQRRHLRRIEEERLEQRRKTMSAVKTLLIILTLFLIIPLIINLLN